VKILTSEQMREVDRLTIERGIPSLILMENAAHRVVEAIAHEYHPLAAQRVVIFCGKGNNGGDGLAVARQLLRRVASLDVLLAAKPEELSGDAEANYKMFRAAGGDTVTELNQEIGKISRPDSFDQRRFSVRENRRRRYSIGHAGSRRSHGHVHRSQTGADFRQTAR
jgi:hydroxyethylthiazole kinase-like uncharacterized protein yjeF